MLLYSLLHLTGVKAVEPRVRDGSGELSVTLDDIKRFRQLDSKCAGPSGVPLDLGRRDHDRAARARAWRPASAWRSPAAGMAAHFNRPGFDMFDYDVYALCGDGCMMEGISGEAASLAGHLELSNLCWIYDNNKITIEGHTELGLQRGRRHALHRATAGTSPASATRTTWRCSSARSRRSRTTNDRPTLIIVDSHIAWGAPNKQDTHAAHGEPLGEEEIKLTKRNYGWPEDAKFLVPDGVREHFAAGIGARGKELRGRPGCTLYEQYRGKHPDLADQLIRMQRRELPDGWDKDLTPFPADPKGVGRPRRRPARCSTRSPRTCRG